MGPVSTALYRPVHCTESAGYDQLIISPLTIPSCHRAALPPLPGTAQTTEAAPGYQHTAFTDLSTTLHITASVRRANRFRSCILWRPLCLRHCLLYPQFLLSGRDLNSDHCRTSRRKVWRRPLGSFLTATDTSPYRALQNLGREALLYVACQPSCGCRIYLRSKQDIW